MVTDAIRQVLAAARADVAAGGSATELSEGVLLARVAAHLSADARPSMRPVFNLTGTVLHTNSVAPRCRPTPLTRFERRRFARRTWNSTWISAVAAIVTATWRESSAG